MCNEVAVGSHGGRLRSPAITLVDCGAHASRLWSPVIDCGCRGVLLWSTVMLLGVYLSIYLKSRD